MLKKNKKFSVACIQMNSQANLHKNILFAKNKIIFASKKGAKLILLPENCFLMAVVKADGYGHGAETVARAALRGGAHELGVATLQEGIELRQAGLTCPILLLGNPEALKSSKFLILNFFSSLLISFILSIWLELISRCCIFNLIFYIQFFLVLQLNLHNQFLLFFHLTKHGQNQV